MKSSGIEQKAILPTVTLKARDHKEEKRSYQKINKEGQRVQHKEKELKLTYGEHVACHTTDGWGIYQYFDDPLTAEGSVRLRKLGTLGTSVRDARRFVWRYRWTASEGKDVLQKVGEHHTVRPSAKNTGKLTPTWEHIPQENIICPITLNEDGTIHNTSWRRLTRKLRTIDSI